MNEPSAAAEQHRTQRIGWLRAAVLGANDGIVSTASLLVGVAAAGTSRSNVLVAGIAGLVAGAMSMAAGEYVSVSSQSDTENADLEREKRELAMQVAKQLTLRGALSAHARDELGISDMTSARPVQAALASGALRVTLWGALAMALTALVGRLFGTVV